MEGEEELRTYRCRQCRASLFTENDIEQHQRGLGQQAFAWAKRATAQGPTCSSLFIDCSLEWLGDMAEQEGKLFCPKCHAKLGAYKWYGDQCSCGYVAMIRTPSDCARLTLTPLPILIPLRCSVRGARQRFRCCRVAWIAWRRAPPLLACKCACRGARRPTLLPRASKRERTPPPTTTTTTQRRQWQLGVLAQRTTQCSCHRAPTRARNVHSTRGTDTELLLLPRRRDGRWGRQPLWHVLIIRWSS